LAQGTENAGKTSKDNAGANPSESVLGMADIILDSMAFRLQAFGSQSFISSMAFCQKI
jgi:hypothetical protein